MATAPTPTPPWASAINGNPAEPVPGTSAAPSRTRSRRAGRTPRSRAGAAWVGICVAALVLVALIVFMLQNTQLVLVSFLGMQGTVPLAVALLIAGVGVGLIALVVGSIRIAQLRRRLSHGG
ncbi:LapA family protein [Promicromonospora sp. Marseille-Q5078]